MERGGEDDVDAERPDGSREEAVETAAVDDVDGRSSDELREEALATRDVDVLAAKPMVVKGDGSPGILNVADPSRQLQFPQQYVVPPQGVTPTEAASG